MGWTLRPLLPQDATETPTRALSRRRCTRRRSHLESPTLATCTMRLPVTGCRITTAATAVVPQQSCTSRVRVDECASSLHCRGRAAPRGSPASRPSLRPPRPPSRRHAAAPCPRRRVATAPAAVTYGPFHSGCCGRRHSVRFCLQACCDCS
eukprot:scaffold6036_cov371-Prasinococcus_capsulatus_cf.AAC.13